MRKVYNRRRGVFGEKMVWGTFDLKCPWHSELQNKGVGSQYESNRYPRQKVHIQTWFSDGLWSIQTFWNQHLIIERFQIRLYNFGFSGKIEKSGNTGPEF